MITLTREQKIWFGERMGENDKGRVIIPSHCYVKLKKLANNQSLTNNAMKTWLIDNVYNDLHLHAHLKVMSPSS